MSNAKLVLDPAFQGVGNKPGTEIWRIEDFKPVPLPKSDYGKFYCGDSYIVLQTSCNKGGAYLFDIHFWIGKDSSQDEAGTAAIKTVELDTMLGGRAVQHREPQGYESDKFLSYFKPCIIPMEGGFASGFKKPEEEKFEIRLYICKGKRAIRVKEVPFSRSSLNHDDVFILDTEKKIYQFNGANSNIQERAKALEVIQHLKEKYHDGVCAVAIVDDGKLQAESDSGEFWVIFGGFAPIGKKIVSDDDVVLETTAPKLYSINNGQLKLEDTVLTKSILENTKCFLLDCGAELFVWVGRVTQVEDRKTASASVEKFVIKENRPKTTRITQVIQGYETHTFKSKFESWPVPASLSSTDCFILQSKNVMFAWIGNSSSFEQQQWAVKVAEFLKPGVAVKHCKEGTESHVFWSAIGGKQSYTSKSVALDIGIREPHLYTFSLRNGKLEVTEVFNFSQDDLLTEDTMVLDTHSEVFVWMGQSVDTKEKQKAFEIGQKYVEHAVAFEGISPDVPLYKVIEGNEPCFFRTYFSWDNIRSVIHGNSFEKKLSVLFGVRSEGGPKSSGDGGPTQRASALAALSSALNPSSQGKQSDERPTSSGDGGHTQRASAMAALSTALNPSSKSSSTQPQSHSGQGSQRAAAVAALSNVLTAEGSHSPHHSRPSPTADAEKAEFAPATPQSETEPDAPEDVRTEPDVSQEQTANENGGQTIFSYERLISKSTDPVSGIDYKRRETYLSDDEFQTVFGMAKEEFYEQPRWKQELQKKKADLF
ncbi:unnamed protein product [Urochloa decumbens]|uniref:HP domain-containing protein n=1 Tax=Urochloa decumbens TaxID=240449 RepID=A0ABC8YCB0_9POAL